MRRVIELRRPAELSMQAPAVRMGATSKQMLDISPWESLKRGKGQSSAQHNCCHQQMMAPRGGRAAGCLPMHHPPFPARVPSPLQALGAHIGIHNILDLDAGTPLVIVPAEAHTPGCTAQLEAAAAQAPPSRSQLVFKKAASKKQMLKKQLTACAPSCSCPPACDQIQNV